MRRRTCQVIGSVNSAGSKDDSLSCSEACVGECLHYRLSWIVNTAATDRGLEVAEVLHLLEWLLNAEVCNGTECQLGQWGHESYGAQHPEAASVIVQKRVTGEEDVKRVSSPETGFLKRV